MPRIPLAAGAMALCLAMPAFAQNTMSSPPAGGAMSSGSMSSMTCDQMMAKVQRMSASSTGARMTMAQNHMHMATMAKQKGDEAGCKMHTQQAMDALK